MSEGWLRSPLNPNQGKWLQYTKVEIISIVLYSVWRKTTAPTRLLQAWGQNIRRWKSEHLAVCLQQRVQTWRSSPTVQTSILVCHNSMTPAVNFLLPSRHSINICLQWIGLNWIPCSPSIFLITVWFSVNLFYEHKMYWLADTNFPVWFMFLFLPWMIKLALWLLYPSPLCLVRIMDTCGSFSSLHLPFSPPVSKPFFHLVIYPSTTKSLCFWTSWPHPQL